MKKLSLFIFAGEQSGDLHGATLIEALLTLDPTFHLSGVGGVKMREKPFSLFLPTEDFEVIGFSDVLYSFPKLWKRFNQILKHLLKHPPDAVIFIDYPGFSLRLAKKLKEKGFKGKVIQYISPTVWAWKKERISHLERDFDLLLTIYPFEKTYFSHTTLPVEYVGNPLLETLKNYPYDSHWQEMVGFPLNSSLIALFPGSRKGEIQRNLPLILETALKLKAKYPQAVFGLSCSHDEIISIMHPLLEKIPLKLYKDIFLVPKNYTYEMMKEASLAIAKSGTVTLELALHCCPTVVLYKLSWFNWFIAKYIYRLNLPFYCIVNILLKKQIFPELISQNPSCEKLFEQACQQWDNKACIEMCQTLPKLLSSENPSASNQAAKAISTCIIKN